MIWYGCGGGCINRGLLHYIAIDRKPENGLVIQNVACGKSGIILCLNLVKRGVYSDGAVNNEVQFSVEVLIVLITPWINSQRIVCADSYSALVIAAELLCRNWLKFIGVVKTATRRFLIWYLSTQELERSICECAGRG